eukprot:3073366-Lingulodinium_polyedra.AAC.1
MTIPASKGEKYIHPAMLTGRMAAEPWERVELQRPRMHAKRHGTQVSSLPPTAGERATAGVAPGAP